MENIIFSCGTIQGIKRRVGASKSMERKLATIRQIQDISPIEGADIIEVIKLDGWQCVSKREEFKKGDLCVYFEIDSFLPVDERYEFLRKSSFRKMFTGQEGFRIKTVRLRGQLSQGMALPLSNFPELHESPSIGDDVTELLKVIKFEKPIPACLSGKVKGFLPSIIPKTDAERIQNHPEYFEKYKDVVFQGTLKLEGSSMTVYNDGGNKGVCSRNLDLEETEENTHWQVAREFHLLDILPEGYAIQGELMGPGIEGNIEKLKSHFMFQFNVYDIENRKYLSPKDRDQFFKDMCERFSQIVGQDYKGDFPVKAPILGEIRLGDYTMQSLIDLSDGPSIHNSKREGIVYTSMEPIDGQHIVFKVISNRYLLGEKE